MSKSPKNGPPVGTRIKVDLGEQNYKFFCVKCELEVEAWKAMETEEGPYTLIVRCHGVQQTIIVPAAEWPLHDGIAFKAHVFNGELNGQKITWWPPPWMWPGL